MARFGAQRLAALLGALGAVAQIWASWPGWLAGDSVAMLREARLDRPIGDWHSPLLIYTWQFLGDVRWGPIIPMVLQVATMWLGLTLLSQRCIRLGWRWGWVILPAAFLLGPVWTPSWVLKDSFTVSVLVLSLGVASLHDVAKRRWATVVWVVPALLVAAACIPRWFLAPALAVAAWGIAGLVGRRTAKQVVAVLGVFAAAVVVLFGVERVVVKPVPQFGSGSTMFLDLARVECVVGTPQSRAEGRSLFPPQFVRPGDPGRDICEDFSPFTHDPLFRFSVTAPTDSPYYVLPADEEQMGQLTDAWLSVWRQYPGILIGDRFKMAGSLMSGTSNVWWSPSIEVMTDPALALPGGVGEGAVVGDPAQPSRGGVLLVALAMVTWAGSQLLAFVPFGMVTILVLPAVAWWRLRRRAPERLAAFRVALVFPAVYLAAFSFVAPSNDVRYTNPAAVWGLLVSLLALAAAHRAPVEAPAVTVDPSEGQ